MVDVFILGGENCTITIRETAWKFASQESGTGMAEQIAACCWESAQDEPSNNHPLLCSSNMSLTTLFSI
jgi:hypothetical protein